MMPVKQVIQNWLKLYKLLTTCRKTILSESTYVNSKKCFVIRHSVYYISDRYGIYRTNAVCFFELMKHNYTKGNQSQLVVFKTLYSRC